MPEETTPPAEGEPTTPPAPKTFTEDQVNAIVQDRLARDRKDRPSDAEIADLRAKATQFDEHQAASLSELEKAQAAQAKAEADSKSVLEKAQKMLVDASIKAEAAGKFIDPTDASQIDRTAIEFDNEGNPTNVGDLVTALLEAKPHLAVKADGGSRGNADQGARTGGGETQLTRDALKHMTPEQITKALAEGRLDNVAAGS